MQWRSDKFLGARLLLYMVVILGPIAMADFAMNHGLAGATAIALVLAAGGWAAIGAAERSARPRTS